MLMVLPMTGALAQGAPIPLVPDGGSAAPPQTPPATLPAPSMVLQSPAATAGSVPTPGNPRDEPVHVQDLGAPDPNATGILDESHGGFGADMWAGADMATVQKVLPLLPAPTPWLTLRRLERRLLLSTAAVPAGRPSGDPLIKLRADKLWALGELDGLVALLKGLPAPAMTPELRRLLVDAALLAGDNAAACDQRAALRAATSDDVFPAKLQVFCQFAAGKASEAGLGVDLLREQKIGDPTFFVAADALSGIAPAGGRLDAFANPSPLSLAMARTAKLALPGSVGAGAASPALLRAITLMPSASPEARLLTAEKAEAIGAVDTETLRQLYQSVTFSPQELSAPLNAAGTDKGIRSRALLFRAAEQQALPAAKAEIIGKALSLAADQGSYFTAARLYAPQLAALKPAPELAWFAYPAARALFAAQKFDAARGWYSFAHSQSTANETMAETAAALAPLVRLAGREDDQPLPTAALDAWRKVRGGPAVEERRTTVLFSLLSGLGDRVPAEAWLPLLDGPAQVAARLPRAALWQGLRVATEDLRLGETVMFALASLGEPGLAQSDPDELYRVVAALHLIGLDADARALAVEAAIANGI